MPTAPPKFPSLSVGSVTFSASRPAIVVPIVATTIESSLSQIQDILNSETAQHVDVFEWRIDHMFNETSLDKLTDAIQVIKNMLGTKRLLVTLRTSQEGGEAQISSE